MKEINSLKVCYEAIITVTAESENGKLQANLVMNIDANPEKKCEEEESNN